MWDFHGDFHGEEERKGRWIYHFSFIYLDRKQNAGNQHCSGHSWEEVSWLSAKDCPGLLPSNLFTPPPWSVSITAVLRKGGGAPLRLSENPLPPHGPQLHGDDGWVHISGCFPHPQAAEPLYPPSATMWRASIARGLELRWRSHSCTWLHLAATWLALIRFMEQSHAGWSVDKKQLYWIQHRES